MSLLALLAACVEPNQDDTSYRNSQDSSSSAAIPAVDVSFVESETDSAHQANGNKVRYYPSQDTYCESQMTLKLEVPTSTVVPKIFVGYYSGSSGWVNADGANNLDGLDYNEILDVGSSDGQAVSLSDNISETDEEGVYEFNYTSAWDNLVDSFPWQFDLYVAATDGNEYGPTEKWTYENSPSSSDDCN